MNLDDSLFALFSFDSADLLAAGAVALPQEALPALDAAWEGWPVFLPPIAGGAPGIPNPWDVFRGIFGSAADLPGKIGEGIAQLWNTFIWPIMGGAIRWLWDCVSYSFTYLKGAVLDLGPNLVQKMWDATGDLWTKLSGGLTALGIKVTDASDWLWKRVEPAFNSVWVWTTSAAQWVYDRVKAALDALWASVSYSLVWGFGRVGALFQWVTDRTAEAAGWTVGILKAELLGGFGLVKESFESAASFITDKFGDLAEATGHAVRDAFEWLWGHLLEPFVDVFERKFAIPGKVARGEYETIDAFLDDLMDPPRALMEGLGLFVSALVLMIPSLLIGLCPAFAPINERWAQGIAKTMPYTLLTRGELQQVRWRGLDFDIEEEYARAGVSVDRRAILAEIDKLIPGPSDLVRFAVREVWRPDIVEKFQTDEDFNRIPEFVAYMQRQGYEEEWARGYWRSHWELPATGMAFEMFHRMVPTSTDPDADAITLPSGRTVQNVIGQTTLETLLRVADIMPFWRDKLTSIAFNPYTRVDIRRMYKAGLTDEDEVYMTYRSLGYTHEHSLGLVEFTKKWSVPAEDGQVAELSDLAAGTIRTGYTRGVITRDEALDYLVAAGYAEDVADFLLTLDDVQLGIRPDLNADISVRDLTQATILRAYATGIWDRSRAQRELEDMGFLPASADLLLQLEDVKYAQDLTDAQVSIVQKRFLRFDIDAAEAGRQLAALGVSAGQQELVLAQWDADLLRAPRKLTTAQLKKALGADLITEEGVRTYLLGLGYGEADADIMMQIL